MKKCKKKYYSNEVKLINNTKTQSTQLNNRVQIKQSKWKIIIKKIYKLWILCSRKRNKLIWIINVI